MGAVKFPRLKAGYPMSFERDTGGAGTALGRRKP
jgi:hypothetical protein